MDQQLKTLTLNISGQHRELPDPFTFVQTVEEGIVLDQTAALAEYVFKLVQPNEAHPNIDGHDLTTAAKELGFTELHIAYQIDGEFTEKKIL
jgi:hypothetical protein